MAEDEKKVEAQQQATTLKLFNGATIPRIGLGTWKSEKGKVAAAVEYAISKAGFRHIDAAWIYGNEEEVGSAVNKCIKDGVCKREDLFITSKLFNNFHDPKHVKMGLKDSLTKLGLDYLDLYLIHWPIDVPYGDGSSPWPKDKDGNAILNDPPIPHTDTWKAMEACVDEGLVKQIGLSNFTVDQVTNVMKSAKIQPAALQCESHPGLDQSKLRAFCVKNNIVFEAYSPIGSPDRSWARDTDPRFMSDPEIVAIGKKYGKSAAQVLIRYQLELGGVVLPKSVTPKWIDQNLNVFDFELSAEDMKTLNAKNKLNWRACGLRTYKDHPNHPWPDYFKLSI